MTTVPASLRELLAGVVDYAGLFPPALLPMADAVREYAEQRHGADSWALARFVVPAVRLEELGAAAGEPAPSWRVSALITDADREIPLVERFNQRHAAHIIADTLEVKLSTPVAIRSLAGPLGEYESYVEVPVADDPAELIEAIADAGLMAKIRTGGLSADAFPTAAQVARFIERCVEFDVSFKATAGLHHPLRGEYPLTYAPDAMSGTMFGFMNVFLAAALLRDGGSMEAATRLLEERDAKSIVITDDAITWRGHEFPVDSLQEARIQVTGFGSCSFREPLQDLRSLGLL
ncbi:MAG: hypothetical protein JWO05_2255 [Gemmatimonadetes bacterium]|nr:hypothetical protein [Gemmatimonadota bacterium]